ncbi:MAG: hypothetical protein L0Y79_13130 [Chlorobi bacterium]|nr:hypothetical protein [Chlorobiota bacterium]MCI0715127.1 hypothetical protein [Chlorobiota bacterium]
MKHLKLFLALILILTVNLKADELNTRKMEQVAKEILDLFIKDAGEKSNLLRKHISEQWLDKKNINVKKFKINNYSPEYYNIIYTGCDVCLAVIGGSSWAHLLVFKFTEEWGAYRVIPKGISEASSDYIDPWWTVKDYICSQSEEK